MYREYTKLTSKDNKESIEIFTDGKIYLLVKIIHRFKVNQFKQYLRFKEKNNLK